MQYTQVTTNYSHFRILHKQRKSYLTVVFAGSQLLILKMSSEKVLLTLKHLQILLSKGMSRSPKTYSDVWLLTAAVSTFHARQPCDSTMNDQGRFLSQNQILTRCACRDSILCILARSNVSSFREV